MRRTISTAMLILAGGAACAQYTTTRICLEGSFADNGRYQVSSLGQVSGMDGATNTAFVWTQGTFKQLLYKTYWSDVHGLNRWGDAVGTVYGITGAGGGSMPVGLLWPFGGAVSIVDKSGYQQNGESINDNGDIALYYHSSQYRGIEVSRLVKGKRTTYRIGGVWPAKINNLCQVLDRFGVMDSHGVLLFTPNSAKTSWTFRDTGLGFGRDLNDSGAAVGDKWVVHPPDPGAAAFPAVYLPSAMYDLPAGTTDLFPEVTAAIGPPSFATAWTQGEAGAINNFGLIVGVVTAGYRNPDGTVSREERAWIRRPFVGTTALLVDGYTNVFPHDINDSGQIVATATSLDDGLSYCLLLTP